MNKVVIKILQGSVVTQRVPFLLFLLW